MVTCATGRHVQLRLCIPNHQGEGVCAAVKSVFGDCNHDLGGTWSTIWTSGINKVGDTYTELCTPLDYDVEWPSCAVGFGGGQCQYADPCVSNEHCDSGYCYKEYPEALGACAELSGELECSIAF